MKQEWISVKDRLPEKYDKFLVLSSFPNDYIIGVRTSYFHPNYKKLGFTTGFDVDQVTHWMPLPEPPKEDQ